MNSMTFVLFGATGDLAKRKIFPALYNLYVEGKIQLPFSVIGLGRKEMADDVFQAYVKNTLHEFSRRTPLENEEFEAFLQSFHYSPLNITNEDDYHTLRQKVEHIEHERNIPENRMFYFSVSPEFFEGIALNIEKSGLGITKGWKRLIIEKPFGHDLVSARTLNTTLNQTFHEDEIYRIDHYLGKGMVQNIETLRFQNSLLTQVWNAEHIDHIQITASETVGVEERASYYDHAGALRDMVQNHLFQMLMLTAMEPGDIRDEKTNVMKSLRPLTKDQVAQHVVRAQYEGYRQEPGVDPHSTTDTFIAMRLFIDNERWSGVPFYIRTGKKMKEKSTRIVVQFKQHLSSSVQPNAMIIEVNPNEGVTFQVNSKNPSKDGSIEPIHVQYVESSSDVPEGYERLIFDAVRGDSTFFARWDEVELSWKWIQQVLDVFQTDFPVDTYAKGTQGPTSAYTLVEQDGFTWND